MRRLQVVWVFVLLVAVGCGGDGGGGGDGDGDGDVEPSPYRIDTLSVRDPHLFALGSIDVTDMVDGLIADGITTDGDDPPDGLLDLSILVVFRPLDQAAASTPMDVVFADCTAPIESTSCVTNQTFAPVDSTAQNDAGDPCLEPLADTTSDYQPAIETPPAPCFASDTEAFVIGLGGIDLALDDAQLAGTYDGDPAAQIVAGLIRGFVSQETADAALLPDDIPLVGGDPVSSLLLDADKDTGPGGADGWYFYLNFAASPVDYSP